MQRPRSRGVGETESDGASRGRTLRMNSPGTGRGGRPRTRCLSAMIPRGDRLRLAPKPLACLPCLAFQLVEDRGLPTTPIVPRVTGGDHLSVDPEVAAVE